MSKEKTKKPTVLIVGASFGGLGCARRLCENGGTKKYRVILVDARQEFFIGGLWQFVWTRRLARDEIVFPLKNANLPGIETRFKTKIQQWQVSKKKVLLQDGSSIPFDYIVMACGVVPDPTSIPGIEQHVYICSFDALPRQQEEVEQLLKDAKTSKQTFCLAIGSTPYKCPPAPFELTFMLDEMLTKAGVRNNVRMVITCPIEWPMPHPTSQEKFVNECTSRNIEYKPMHVVDKIQDKTIRYKSGDTLEASLIWTVYRIRAPDFVQEAIPTNEKGTITIDDPATNAIPYVENAYAIGDCCQISFEDDITIPKAGEFAWKMGVSVADTLMVSSDKEKPTIDCVGACVAEIGFGKGIALKSDFSNACMKRGDPEFYVGESTRGQEEKVEWVNGYLAQIFGDKAPTLELSSNGEDQSRKRQRLE